MNESSPSQSSCADDILAERYRDTRLALPAKLHYALSRVQVRDLTFDRTAIVPSRREVGCHEGDRGSPGLSLPRPAARSHVRRLELTGLYAPPKPAPRLFWSDSSFFSIISKKAGRYNVRGSRGQP